MDALTRALYRRLTDDVQLTGYLAAIGDGFPAVFTTEPVPTGATRPFLILPPAVTDVDVGAKNLRRREVTRDARLYDDPDAADPVPDLEAAAERLREILERHRLDVDGWRTVLADVSGPVDSPADTGHARLVSVRYVLAAD